ncbi:MAG: hypothetical protein GC161_18215 [Planctomycetaceae bacterium]|nr:hypothetical protein [Planctomycetaceae bacterium]
MSENPEAASAVPEPKSEGLGLGGCCGIAVFVVLGMAVLGAIVPDGGGSARDRAGNRNNAWEGEHVVVEQGAFAGVTLEDLRSFEKSRSVGDTYGTGEMLRAGLAFWVSKGSKALVIDREVGFSTGLRGNSAYRIRLLDGTLTGQSGWIHTRDAERVSAEYNGPIHTRDAEPIGPPR